MPPSETEKIRDQVKQYCVGNGIDIGARHDKIVPEALGIDIEDKFNIDRVLDASKPLPFKDSEFNYVFSSHCLEHIKDTENTLKEWVRILKVEGYLILYLPHRDLYKVNNPEHFHNFTSEDIIPILQKLGIKILKNIIHEYSFLIVGIKQEDKHV